jgi:hypothetical protein
MTETQPADICYLLAMPLQVFPARAQPKPDPAQRDAPYFFDIDIEFVAANTLTLVIDEVSIEVHCQILDRQVWLAECHYRLPNLWTTEALTRHRAIQQTLTTQLREQTGYSGAFIETYTVLLVGSLDRTPDEFVDAHTATLVRWLRSLDKVPTEKEASKILGGRIHYSERDLTLVDRRGAIIIAEKEDFQFDLQLLKIGNYQLLRYRLLDRTIEKGLQQLRQYATQKRAVWWPSRRKQLQAIVAQRLSLVLDFEKIDQSLLLIGDWYSAQVYRAVVAQLSLDQWKTIVQGKIESLLALNDIVYQDLAFSWRWFLDFVMLIGWLILLVGYFILFFAGL